jgi:hypothetical protein
MLFPALRAGLLSLSPFLLRAVVRRAKAVSGLRRTSRDDSIDFLFAAWSMRFGRIEDRLDSIQQQITSAAPVSEAKPADGKPAKGKKGH